ncbi:MAG: hypothetical protein IJG34_03180 [Synergistaceae bacterium]|nr:hypothetical protein [Synergistaceae bacterium]MBQ3448883.1 hypothetical protein [Synergistaceae bacterium]MBQ3693517.1 hypothetical protein [Synergistaceae bacterium]MBQ6112158.1 hypothetical protein [Synergistaceae bacterium]MBR0250434.1 hypothetical protein [Synergistaceae bacterium]
MLSSIATRDTIQEHISEYLDMMENGEEIIMTKNGKEIGRFLPRGKVVTLIGERLKGILSKEIDAAKVREEMLRKKYEIAD